MDCNECKARAPQPVDFLVHQADMARMERTIKRLWILCLVLALLLVGSWIAVFVYESQFETVTETTTERYEAYAEGDGAALNNRSGVINYGIER